MSGILIESYLLALGYATLMECDQERAHLFARNYDFPISVDQLKIDFEAFQARGRVLGLIK